MSKFFNRKNTDEDFYEDDNENLAEINPSQLANSEAYDEDFYDDYDNDYYDDVEMRDYHPIRFRRDGKLGIWGGVMYAVFIISVSSILACIGWLFASDVLALNKDVKTALVTVKAYDASEYDADERDEEPSKAVELLSSLVDKLGSRGDDEEAEEEEEEEDDPYSGDPNVDIDLVAGALKDAGIIEYKFLFKLYSKLSHAAYKIEPGTYELSTLFDYRALVKKMQIGSESQVVTTVTFPEGFNSEQIFKRLEANNICSADALRDAAANFPYSSYDYISILPYGSSNRLEGFLFPDTYDFYEGMAPENALGKLLRNFYNKMTAEMFDKAENLGYTFNECITIASMIEKEAANDDERAKIASVIYNRLKAGMPLQIDATSLYSHPEHEGAPTQEMLNDASDPYNTRIKSGIPPTPISNPGIASINAALNPESTGYYYYALDTETMTHRFFTNSREFDAFIATQSY